MPRFTPAQLVALKALISDPQNPLYAADYAIGNDTAVKTTLNADFAPAYYAIRTDAPVKGIKNAVVWPNYTPQPAITGANAAQHTACSNACMAKATVLQSLLGLGDGGTFDATQATSTGGLKDATTALPSGTGFAAQTGGWPAIIPVLQRRVTNAERLFVTANAAVAALQNAASARGTQYDGANGNPDLLGWAGTVDETDVAAARNGTY